MGKVWVAAVVFFAVLFIGLRFMSAGLVHYDSVRLAQSLENWCDTGELSGISAGGRFGMVAVSTLVYAPFCWAGQNADLAVRLTGVIFLALAALATYLLAQEMFRNRFAAIAASILVSVIPVFIIPATYGKEHSVAVALFTFACWAALRSHRSLSKIWPVAASLLFVASLTVREGLLLGLPIFLWFLVFPRLRGSSIVFGRGWIWGLSSFALVFLVVLVAFLGRQLIAVSGDTGVSSFHFDYPLLGISNLISLTGLYWIVVLVGIFWVWRTCRDFLLPLVVWIALAIPVGMLGGYLPRYLDIVFVGWALLAAAGLTLIAGTSRKRLLVGSLALIVVVMLSFWAALPFLEARHQHSNLKAFSEYVESVTEPDSLIVAMDESAFIEYYGHRKATSFSATVENKDELAQEFIGIKRNGTNIYVLRSCFDYPGGQNLEMFLQVNFNTSVVGSHIMENYHDADGGLTLRNISIILVGEPIFNVSNL